MDAETFDRLQRVLAEPKRLDILASIRRNSAAGPVTCSCVLGEMEISQSTFSHHITTLVDAGLVSAEKSGRFVHMSVNEPLFNDYLEALREKVLGIS